ncbi:MAG: dihydropyrimidinase [Candidatus Omnitrophota bacterium]
MPSLLVKHGTLVTASDWMDRTDQDILIVDGVIRTIGTGLDPLDSDTQIIDATGCYLFPGGIDPHVHMALPIGNGLVSSDDFESGTRAALAGGTTTLIDFITPVRGQSLLAAAEERMRLARRSRCHCRFHMSVTSWHRRIPSEMRTLKERDGICSVKVYMAYKQTIGLNDREILKVMDAAAKLDLLVMVHGEHGETIDYLQHQFISEGKRQPEFHAGSRPPEVEGEAVQRAIMMARAAGCSLYIVHVSTQDAVLEIERARGRGLPVYAETCPHYLLLDEAEYRRPGFEGAAYVVSPPLRSQKHRDALWDAVGSGVIQVVSTDHCPFNMKGQKDRGIHDFTQIPNGAAGVQHRLELLYRYGVLENKISLRRFVELTSEQPARIFKLYPQKGTLAPGADADIVVWDPEIRDTISARTHLHRCDTSIYEGFSVKGKARDVILRGKEFLKKDNIDIE